MPSNSLGIVGIRPILTHKIFQNNPDPTKGNPHEAIRHILSGPVLSNANSNRRLNRVDRCSPRGGGPLPGPRENLGADRLRRSPPRG